MVVTAIIAITEEAYKKTTLLVGTFLDAIFYLGKLKTCVCKLRFMFMGTLQAAPTFLWLRLNRTDYSIDFLASQLRIKLFFLNISENLAELEYRWN